MKYTLTRANPQADQYPLQERQIVTDPLQEEVNKNVFMTRLEDVMHNVVNWGRKNSIWPLPFATSCCGIEFMATMGSTYDLARFGSERLAFTPRQCDLLMVMGTISKKMAPVLKQVYIQMAEPRWVIAVGACASSGGIFDTYSVLQGIDEVIPVDVYVPGCPAKPEAIIDGVVKALELVKAKLEGKAPDHSLDEAAADAGVSGSAEKNVA